MSEYFIIAITDNSIVVNLIDFPIMPTIKKHGTFAPCFFMVEMIRLELTTYTLRTYRSTG